MNIRRHIFPIIVFLILCCIIYTQYPWVGSIFWSKVDLPEVAEIKSIRVHYPMSSEHDFEVSPSDYQAIVDLFRQGRKIRRISKWIHEKVIEINLQDGTEINIVICSRDAVVPFYVNSNYYRGCKRTQLDRVLDQCLENNRENQESSVDTSVEAD